ncbi:FAD-binding oxidoreductase [Kribbella sp. DT2]|uniref:FAD-binding oxidoreductase n=1 Tax=Kribbella sp. DT2 TaxID=3393427 RepID=UPI003CE6A581
MTGSSVVRAGIDGLRAVVKGEVLVAGDAAYQVVSRTLNVVGRPAVVVRCAGAEDIAAALRYAGEYRLPVAVRSGGHHPAGFGTNDGGVVIDVGLLDEVTVLPGGDGRVVRVGTGATWGRVAGELAGAGLAISSGDTAGVGVGGLLGGGGIGWMVRRLGLALDSVVAAEVVTADGVARRLDAVNEPELFWGVRGAAGSLGVVTSYDVVADRQPTVLFGNLLFPWTQLEQVLTGWAAYMADAPVELSSSVQLPPTMVADRQAPIAVMVCVSGELGDAGRLLAPLRSLGTLLTDTVTEVPYGDILTTEQMPPGWTPRMRNGLFERWVPELVEQLADARRRMPAMAVDVRALGGAYGAVAPEATAFAHREAGFMVNGVLLGSTELHGGQIDEFEELWAALAPEAAYGNFLSHPTAGDLDRCFPKAHRDRLAALKDRFDPTGVFGTALTVPPTEHVA